MACILDWGGIQEDHLPLAKSTHKNSFQASIGMTPYEALYGRPCRLPSYWLESLEVVIAGSKMLHEVTKRVKIIREQVKATQVRQKSWADGRRKVIEFQVGEHVYFRYPPQRELCSLDRQGIRN